MSTKTKHVCLFCDKSIAEVRQMLVRVDRDDVCICSECVTEAMGEIGEYERSKHGKTITELEKFLEGYGEGKY